MLRSSVRSLAATNPVFTDKSVGVGDKWSHDFTPDSDLGTRGGHADYEVLGFEKVSDVEVWGVEYFGDTRTLDVHIKRLRAKIEEDPRRPEHVKTVRGLGYKLQL